MTESVNGIQLYYEKKGSGRPLLLIHGNGEDHTIFREAVEMLQDHYTCYSIDSRCHGLSTGFGDLHYEEMAQDILCFMDHLDLHDVIFYGFSDGGILGLLAASRSDRITTLVTSGANLSPDGVVMRYRILFRILNLIKQDPKIELMMHEPDISDSQLRSIRARTLVLAGSDDLILEKQTRHIASMVPNAELRILPGETHGSYIVHSRKIAHILLEFCH